MAEFLIQRLWNVIALVRRAPTRQLGLQHTSDPFRLRAKTLSHRLNTHTHTLAQRRAFVVDCMIAIDTATHGSRDKGERAHGHDRDDDAGTHGNAVKYHFA